MATTGVETVTLSADALRADAADAVRRNRIQELLVLDMTLALLLASTTALVVADAMLV